jgi:leucyl-tRNA synthetase
MHLTTGGSSLLELVNELYAFSQQSAHGAPARDEPPVGRVERSQTLGVLRECVDALIVMISPFAPHMAEELWHMMNHPEPLQQAAWPAFNSELAKEDQLVVPIQVNGKVRGRITVATGTSDQELQERALAEPTVKTYTEGKTIKKVVVVKGSLVSVVVA